MRFILATGGDQPQRVVRHQRLVAHRRVGRSQNAGLEQLGQVLENDLPGGDGVRTNPQDGIERAVGHLLFDWSRLACQKLFLEGAEVFISQRKLHAHVRFADTASRFGVMRQEVGARRPAEPFPHVTTPKVGVDQGAFHGMLDSVELRSCRRQTGFRSESFCRPHPQSLGPRKRRRGRRCLRPRKRESRLARELSGVPSASPGDR